MRSGKENLIGIAQGIKWLFGGTVANIGIKHERRGMGYHAHSEERRSTRADILVGDRLRIHRIMKQRTDSGNHVKLIRSRYRVVGGNALGISGWAGEDGLGTIKIGWSECPDIQ